MTPKPWYQSKTVWAQLITLAVAIASLFVEPLVLTQLGLPPVLADHYRAWLLMVIAVLNVLLRFVTSQPLAGTPAAHAAARSRRVAERFLMEQ